MRKINFKKFLVLFSLVFFIACGKTEVLNLKITKAVKSEQGKIMSFDMKKDDLSFSDENIDLNFDFQKSQIIMNLKNKSKEAIFINWDMVTLLNQDNMKEEFINLGARTIVSNPNYLQEEAIIPAGESYSTKFAPRKNVGSYANSSTDGEVYWAKEDMLNKDNPNKKIQILFPLNFGKKELKVYGFDFEIK